MSAGTSVAASVQNLEDAAGIASEFISSLDHLPHEIRHLLDEIKRKEAVCQALQQEIAKDQARYVKHSLKQNASASGSSPHADPSAAPGQNGQKAHLPGRIAAAYAAIEIHSNDKLLLARRMLDLLTRTRARLDHDLSRVRVLQGEPPESIRASSALTRQDRGSSLFSTQRHDRGLPKDNPAVQIRETLRNAVASSPVTEGGNLPAAPPAAGSSYKKRRLTTTSSIKLLSPAPATTSSTSTSHSRSRQSRQAQSKKQMVEEFDVDTEEEDVGEEDADEEDTRPYCFCQKQSYGDMIGCDNPNCPYQWFHISCVGVKQPLPDKWYCPECHSKGAGGQERRKGRKK